MTDQKAVKQNHLTGPDENTQLLMDKKIADTKIKVLELRIIFILAAFGVVGVLIPFLLTSYTSFQYNKDIRDITNNIEERFNRIEDKVDKKLDDFEKQFKELAGEQLRKPELVCYIEGKLLKESLVKFDYKKRKKFIIKNIGNRRAESIDIVFFINDKRNQLELNYISNQNGLWSFINSKELEGYNVKGTYDKYKHGRLVRDWFVDAQNTIEVPLGIYNTPPKDKDGRDTVFTKSERSKALMRLFYGTPQPLDIPFEIEYGVK